MIGTATRMFSPNPTFVSASALRGSPGPPGVAEHGVVTNLLELGVGQDHPQSAPMCTDLPPPIGAW
jgi:hypothetical protein